MTASPPARPSTAPPVAGLIAAPGSPDTADPGNPSRMTDPRGRFRCRRYGVLAVAETGGMGCAGHPARRDGHARRGASRLLLSASRRAAYRDWRADGLHHRQDLTGVRV